MELQAALDELANLHADLVGLRRTGEGEQVLHDLGGAAGLAMGQVELAARAGSSVAASRISFGDAQDCGQRIIQLVRYAGNHLTHGCQALGLDQLLFHALGFGDVASGSDDALDVAAGVQKRAGRGPEQAHLAVFVFGEIFDGGVEARAGDQGVKQRLHLLAVMGIHALRPCFLPIISSGV